MLQDRGALPKAMEERRRKVSRKRKREGEKGEDETVAVKSSCVNPFFFC